MIIVHDRHSEDVNEQVKDVRVTWNGFRTYSPEDDPERGRVRNIEDYIEKSPFDNVVYHVTKHLDERPRPFERSQVIEDTQPKKDKEKYNDSHVDSVG